jgi:hypothetical protein
MIEAVENAHAAKTAACSESANDESARAPRKLHIQTMIVRMSVSMRACLQTTPTSHAFLLSSVEVARDKLHHMCQIEYVSSQHLDLDENLKRCLTCIGDDIKALQK